MSILTFLKIIYIILTHCYQATNSFSFVSCYVWPLNNRLYFIAKQW